MRAKYVSTRYDFVLLWSTYAVLLVVLAMEVKEKPSANFSLGHLQVGVVLGIHLLAQRILNLPGETVVTVGLSGGIFLSDFDQF